MVMPTRKLLHLTSPELMQAWNRVVVDGVVRSAKIPDIVLKLTQCGHGM